MPCYQLNLSTAWDLLKSKYRIRIQPEDEKSIEDWLKKKLTLKENVPHKEIKEKLDQLKKDDPTKWRPLEYEFIQFIKQLKRKTPQKKEQPKEPKTAKSKEEAEAEEKQKQKEIEAMYR